MRTVNVVTALVFLALSAALLAGTLDLAYWSDFSPGPAFAPVWIATAGAVLSLLLLLQEWRTPSGDPGHWPDRSAWTRVLTTLAALCVALTFAPQLGFVATMALLTLFIVMVVERRRLMPSLIVMALTTALIHGVFVAWLNVALPKGVLGI